MNSNNIYEENSDPIYYCYFIGWSNQNMYYYGRRTAKESNPKEFWVTYFTSSKHVKKFREEFGEPDIIQIRKTFKTVEECKYHESKVLKRLMASKRNDFLNKTNGDKNWDATGNEYFAKEYKIKTPEGDIVYIKNLTKFCEENDLIHSNMVAAASTTSKRKTIHHKLYQIRKINDDRPFLPVEDLQIDYYIIKYKDEEPFEVQGLYQIAIELGVDRSHLYTVANGNFRQHIGYQVRKKGDPRPFYTQEELDIKTCSKEYIVKSPTGKIYNDVISLNKFCKEHGLRQSVLASTCNPNTKTKSYKGWQARLKCKFYEFYDISELTIMKNKIHIFIYNNEKEFVVDNIAKFEKENNLRHGVIQDLIGKKQKQYNGWKYKETIIIE